MNEPEPREPNTVPEAEHGAGSPASESRASGCTRPPLKEDERDHRNRDQHVKNIQYLHLKSVY
jgi:hypothetical protein